MNKNFKVITINGIRGMFAAIFIVMGLVAGFIISPGWLCMTLWNHFIGSEGILASMNLIQGIMLWAIIALSLYALNNKRSLIGFGSYQGLTPDQIKDIMNRARLSEENVKRNIELLSKEIKEKSEILNNEGIINKEQPEEAQNEQENKEEIGSHS